MKQERNKVPNRELIALCCVCDKTRNDLGKWVVFEKPPVQREGIVYTHGMCPACTEKLYGNEIWYKERGEVSPKRPAAEVGGNMRDRKKMLIVDDNSMVRNLLKADFEEDFKVEVATCGAEGLETALRWRPEVILLDSEMPDMSGTDVVRSLGAQPETRNIPVIVITANDPDSETQRQLQLQENFKGLYSKIAPPEEIKDAVQRILL